MAHRFPGPVLSDDIRSGLDLAGTLQRHELRSLLLTQRLDEGLRRLESTELSHGQHVFPRWNTYASLAGNDWDSRHFFRRMVSKSPELFLGDQRPIPRDDGNRDRHTGLSPRRFPLRTDELGWAMILMMDRESESASTALSWRLSSALGRPGYGPLDDVDTDVTLRKMIGQWLLFRRDIGLPSDQLYAALRYRCDDSAIELCHEYLNDPALPAACHAAALLTLASVETRFPNWADSMQSGRDSIDRIAHSLRTDQRTCFYRAASVPSDHVHTKVQDVAWAVTLFRHGIDPRTIGFEHLQADPFLIFRPESLGFHSQADRENALQQSQRRLMMLEPAN